MYCLYCMYSLQEGSLLHEHPSKTNITQQPLVVELCNAAMTLYFWTDTKLTNLTALKSL